MALNIRSAAAETAVRQLADLTGESLADAVTLAARERMERIAAERRGAESLGAGRAMDDRRRAELTDLIHRMRAEPIRNNDPDDVILGYNESGTFD